MLALLKRNNLTKDEIKEATQKLKKYKRDNDNWHVTLVIKN